MQNHASDTREQAVPLESASDTREQAAPFTEAASEPFARTAALIVGGPILPAPLLTELVRAGAKVRFIAPPDVQPEERYRPSTALDEWVRMRDLTCRAPGCERSAVFADIDHTVPWPVGATHPSNNKCYCRKHHLIKTFWPGFTDRQHPDGTIEWTTPTGHTYTTRPGSALLFPDWAVMTAALPEPPAQSPPSPNRGLMMPRRKRTRAKERQYRINAERALNKSGDIAPPF